MIRSANKIIQNKKIRGKTGGDANESCFGGWERELRKRKVLVVGGINGENHLKLEQAWNKLSKNLDIVRLVMTDENGYEIELIADREELEQALGYMAQGDEMLKYANSRIK